VDGSADARGAGARVELRSVVERALDALAPAFARIVGDQAVSFEHALHVVVMDPAAAPASGDFDRAVLVERSFGAPERWEADYAHYARAKARVAWREGMTTSALVEGAPARLRAGDLVVEGAVCRYGMVVAASGAQPWYDAACAAMVAELVHAALRDAVNAVRAKGGTW
jgi:hypothetical protein